MTQAARPEGPLALLAQLEALRTDLIAVEAREAEVIAAVHETHRASARNLIHYLALRRLDLGPLQQQLGELGLSSLGRAEPHVLFSLDAVLGHLRRLAGAPAPPPSPAPVGFHDGPAILVRNADRVLGPCAGRGVRIMVTMPSEAADDYLLVRDLLAGGMDVMRINCAHDGPPAWERILEHLARARRELGRPCRVLMDLGGPKLRTGAIAPGPAVLKWRPRRDPFGKVLGPARIWLTAQELPATAPSPADATLPVPRAWLAAVKKGDAIDFRDARGSARVIRVTAEVGEGRWGECSETAYVTPGLELKVGRGAGKARVGPLPPQPQALHLHRGEVVVVTRPEHPGQPSTRDAGGAPLHPATIPCTLPEVFADVRLGERIWFDDGRIGGVVRFVNADQIHVEIVNAREKGEALKADKGINLPDSTLRLPPLTADDRRDLAFVARHADVVGYSFVREASDVEALRQALDAAGGSAVGVVLKIETRAAFERLPHLLLAAMRSPSVAVMIARGDLAVEMGYERLAEVQEEILWICEAAHVPVIWATQVLETLAKEGLPSRAEITDAAMGERAECVMLNKGPHVLEALRLLDDILVRMQGHAYKKSPVLRGLKLARDGLASHPAR